MLKKIVKLAMATAAVLVTALFLLLVKNQNTGFLTARASSAASFISDYQSDVKRAANKYNLYGSVMMSQAALESGWGQSELTQQANNFFGIKGAYNGQSVTMPTVEYDSNGQLKNTTASFKKYPTAYASFADNGATLRNGTSWDPDYYSGTWKENAATYEDAANALTGKYATAPNYGSSLIKIIQQYGLDKTFGETNSQSSSSSSANVSSASSSTTTSTQAATPTLATVKYYKGDASQAVQLSKHYSKYYVYNHVKGTSPNEKRYRWKSLGIRKAVTVYLDMRGVKKGTSDNWYRFRLYPNSKSKRFWVYAPALQFSTIYSGATSGHLKANNTSGGELYTHVYGSPLLASKVARVSTLKAKTSYPVDQTALAKTSTGFKVWYRIKVGKHKGWLSSSHVTTFPAKVAKVDFKTAKVVSSSAKADYLYTDLQTSGQFQKHYKLAQVDLNIGNKVKVDKLGYRLSDQSLWYRIVCPTTSSKYWVSSKFLS